LLFWRQHRLARDLSDRIGLQLVALNSQQIPLGVALVSVAVTQHGFYLFVNQNANFSTAELEGIFFDPVTSQPSATQQLLNVGITAQRMSVDTLGKNLVLSAGQACSNLWFASLSPTDGRGTHRPTSH
jgi:hypothetical protein